MPKFEVKDTTGNTTISLDGDTADISAGDHGKNGDIVLKDHLGKERIRIGRITEASSSPPGGSQGDSKPISGSTQYWGMRVRTADADAVNVVEIGRMSGLSAQTSSMQFTIGGDGAPGSLIIRDGDYHPVVRLNASNGTVTVGGSSKRGEIVLKDDAKDVTLTVVENGQLSLRIPSGKDPIVLDAYQADLWIGGSGTDGDIAVLPSTAQVRDTAQASIHLDGDGATLRIGLLNKAGKISVRDSKGLDAFRVESSDDAHMFIGAVGINSGTDGFVHVVNHEGKEGVFLDGGGLLRIGAENGLAGVVEVFDAAGNERITLDGNTGDIRLRGADCAEHFDVTDSEQIEPGSVLVMDDNGKLRPCEHEYDKRVIGVVSGANGVNPGIILGNIPGAGKRSPIALTGTVYCKVDARRAPIERGDLLTTSSTPGHAMKAKEGKRAFGTIIGKAMADLKEGCSLLPIVATLR